MRTLSEHESKALLAAHGVPLPPERLVADADAAVAAALEVGLPVAAKLNGDGIAHKTERGLVRLGLTDEAAVRRAATDLLAAATPDDGEVGVLIAPMVSGSRELIAGLHTDDQFGPSIMLGIGGVLAEAIADVAFRLAPLTDADADDLVDDLRTTAVLGEFRGGAPVDRDALRRLLVGLGQVPAAHPEVRSIDLNPVIVADDGSLTAVDALVEVLS